MQNSSKIIKVLFDGSVLEYGLRKDNKRSGVFYVAYQLLKELSKKENIKLTILTVFKCTVQWH